MLNDQSETHPAIRVHLGAHKTASTHLQHTLARNRKRLAREGTAYIPLSTLRSTFTPAFRTELRRAAEGIVTDAPVELWQILERCIDQTTECHSLVISDENLLGGLSSLERRGLLYPERLEHLNLMHQVLRNRPVRVLFAIRDYPNFYASAYAELVRAARTTRSFTDFLTRIDFERNRWTEIVRDFCEVFGKENVQVFRYEDYRDNTVRILQTLLGSQIDLKVRAKKPVRESLTSAGVRAMLAVANTLSGNERRQLGNYLATQFNPDQPEHKITMEDKNLERELRELYAGDVEQLSASIVM